MQEIIVENKPYEFIPPHYGEWIPTWIQRLKLVDRYLSRVEGITSHEVRGIERLNESLRRGDGIVLAPNHCRYADPLALAKLAREADVFLFSMASWHLFNQSRFQAFAIRMCGGFSVYREGLDRKSIDTAIAILTEARRPLTVFPEGTVFRSNDILQPLLDGIGFVARTAARRRAKQGRGIVTVHPIAIKYLFRGELESTVEPVLSAIEQRFNWHPRPTENLLQRVQQISEAVLTLHEVKHIGQAQQGSTAERQRRLVEHLLQPLEERWLGRVHQLPLIPRVKQLRAIIVPHLFKAQKGSAEHTEIWTDLRDIYLAQQIASHPSDYLDQPTDTRVLETIERIEEELYDRATVHRPLHVILEVGEAITVDPEKPSKGVCDPLMEAIAGSLRAMLSRLAKESRPIRESG